MQRESNSAESLRDTIARGGVHVHYQPQVSFQTGKIIGAEALVRLQRNGSTIMPNDFISMAEENGEIEPLFEEVMRLVGGHIGGIRRKKGIRIYVNLSAKQVNAQLPIKLYELLRRLDISSDAIGIEITESILMQDIDFAVQILQQVGDMGIRLSLDDFGMGYSSLSYLKELPINTLKIDRAFVQDIQKEKGVQIVTAILQLARSVNMNVVAEGVENRQQFEILKLIGCNAFQGYFYSRPVASEAFLELMKAEKKSAIDFS